MENLSSEEVRQYDDRPITKMELVHLWTGERGDYSELAHRAGGRQALDDLLDALDNRHIVRREGTILEGMIRDAGGFLVKMKRIIPTILWK